MKEFDAADVTFSGLSADKITGMVLYEEKACHHWALWSWVLDRIGRHNHTRLLGYYDHPLLEPLLLKNGESLTVEYDGSGYVRISTNKEDQEEA